MYLEAFCRWGNWWLFITCMDTEIYILLWRKEIFLGNEISYFIKTDVRKWAYQGKQCPPGGCRWGQGWSQLLTGNTASVRCLFFSTKFCKFPTVLQQLNLCEVVAFCIQVTLSLQTLTLCALKVLENGSGEDLAVFCRSVISYCGKKGVEVKETIIKQKKIRQEKDQTKITKIVFVWRLTKEIEVKVKRVYNWVGEIGNCKVWLCHPGGATPLLLSCCTLLPLTWPCRLWCLRQEIVTLQQLLVSSIASILTKE